MRIAIVSHSFPPARVGGTEVYAAAYARALAAAGHEVFVYTAEKNISQRNFNIRRESAGGVEITWLTNNLFYKKFHETFDAGYFRKPWLVFLERVRPEIVHFQHLLDVGAVLPRETKKFNSQIATGMTLHDFWFTCPRFGQRYHPDGYICKNVVLDTCARCVATMEWRQPRGAAAAGAALRRIRNATGIDLTKPARGALARLRGNSRPAGPPAELLYTVADRGDFFDKEVFPFIDQFFSPAAIVADELQKAGVPRERVLVRTLGLELTTQLLKLRDHASKRDAAPRDSILQIAFHGQVTKTKAPDLLIRAWQSLAPETRARARLVIRGAPRDPVFHKEIEALAASAGVVMEPPFGRAELADRLAHTDLLVVPSVWWENAPVSISEAFAARVPVLVAGHGGMAEMVEEGRGGFRFAPGDAADLTRVLTHLIHHPKSLRDAARHAPVVRDIASDAAELPALITKAAARG